jgi:glycosyltransferase involved in cell wall biosynthesis
MMMCVVVPSFNNEANFRIEYNLNSIFAQNYTNFKVVVIDDASIDKSGKVYRSYFKFYDIDPQRYVYIENTEKKNSL